MASRDRTELDVSAIADDLQDRARDAARVTASASTTAWRQVVRAVMAVPMLVGRLGVVAGQVGVRLGTLLGLLSTWLSDGSDRARTALDRAAAVDVRDLTFEAPRVRTRAEVRRAKGRRLGTYALVAGLAGGVGAGIAWVARRRRDEAALAEEALWADPTTDPWAGDGQAPEGRADADEVIDVTSAER